MLFYCILQIYTLVVVTVRTCNFLWLCEKSVCIMSSLSCLYLKWNYKLLLILAPWSQKANATEKLTCCTLCQGYDKPLVICMSSRTMLLTHHEKRSFEPSPVLVVRRINKVPFCPVLAFSISKADLFFTEFSQWIHLFHIYLGIERTRTVSLTVLIMQ